MAIAAIPQGTLEKIPKELPTKRRMVNYGYGGMAEAGDPYIDPARLPSNAIALENAVSRMGGYVGVPTGEYRIPVDIPELPKTDARGLPLPQFYAFYGTDGKLKNIQPLERYWATSGQGDNDIHVQPAFGPTGELLGMNENTNAAAGGTSFFSQLGQIAKETAPIWTAALGANLFTGANLLGGGASAAAPALAGGESLFGLGGAAGSTGTGLTLGSGGVTGLTAGGGSLGLTAASPGAAAIGGSLGSQLAGISTGIGAAGAGTALSNLGTGGAAGTATGVDYGLTSGVGTAGAAGTTAATGAAPSVFDQLAGYGSKVVDFAKANPSIAGSLLGALGGAIDASNAPKEQTSTTSIDPQIKAEYLANLERAKAAAAGLTAKQYAEPGQMYTDAEKALYNLGMTPFGAADIQQFYNPYEEQVVQGALGDIERSRQMQDVADRARAVQARAFGGSRQAVQSALTNEAALRQAATTASGLRQTGFTQAANLGLSARPLNIAGLQTSLGLGSQRDALAQARLDAARNLPLERLSITGGALGLQPANVGQTSSQPLYTSTAGSALSGGLTGAYIGSLLDPNRRQTATI